MRKRQHSADDVLCMLFRFQQGKTSADLYLPLRGFLVTFTEEEGQLRILATKVGSEDKPLEIPAQFLAQVEIGWIRVPKQPGETASDIFVG